MRNGEIVCINKNACQMGQWKRLSGAIDGVCIYQFSKTGDFSGD